MTERNRGMFSADTDDYLGHEPELVVEELAPGVWTATDGDYRALFADGDDQVVALNTLGTPGRARAYRRAIEDTVPGKPVGTVVMTIGSVRRLLDRGFDRLVPVRSTPMTPDQVRTALEYFEAMHEASQRAFAEGVPIWEYEAMREYVEGSLGDRFASLQGFERHVGIGAIRIVHHYLMGGWGLEDTMQLERLLAG